MIWLATIEMHVEADSAEEARDKIELTRRYADEVDLYAKSQVSFREVDHAA